MNIHKIRFMANLFIIFIANFPVASPLSHMQQYVPVLAHQCTLKLNTSI